MTPDERQALGFAIRDLFTLLSPDEPSLGTADWTLADDSESEIAGYATRALRRATRELAVMADYLQAQVKLSSDHLAALQSVQAEMATEARSERSAKQAARARELRAEGLSTEQTAVRMTVERDAADAAAGRPVRQAPIRGRTVERYLARDKKPPTDRRTVGRDDEQPDYSPS